MNSQTQTLPEPSRNVRAEQNPAPCSLIITVESGVVTGILPTGPVEAVVVDLDMIENEDVFERRMHKAVLPLDPDNRIHRSDINATIAVMVSEYRRPDRQRTAPAALEAAAEAASRRCA